MKQYEAVIEALERLGGVATLGRLYVETFRVSGCEWHTKTPLASIRRIVQTNKAIFRIKPGLYALERLRTGLRKRGIVAEAAGAPRIGDEKFTHTYFQSLLVEMGNMCRWATFVPRQDKNKALYDGRRLGDLATLDHLPPYAYPDTVRRSATVDVVWMNGRRMPHTFFEVEHTTDIQNSLLKFADLIDFSANMVIVADQRREEEFRRKLSFRGFDELRNRHGVGFLSYTSLIRQYERELENRKETLFLSAL